MARLRAQERGSARSEKIESKSLVKKIYYQDFGFLIGLATKSFRFFPFENHEKKRNDFVANPIHVTFGIGWDFMVHWSIYRAQRLCFFGKILIKNWRKVLQMKFRRVRETLRPKNLNNCVPGNEIYLYANSILDLF